MKPHPHVPTALRRELYDWRLWASRSLVLTFAVIAGLTVVTLTWLSEHALSLFFSLQGTWWWAPLVWTPLLTAIIAWCTQRWAPGASGSGIPQVMAALAPETPPASRHLFVSMRLTVAKLLLTASGCLAGLSLGREGPSVQIAAGVMHHTRRWLPSRGPSPDQGLLIAGGAAGIAAAFNTPLGGVMFAIEELSRRPEQRSNGLMLAAIVLAGLMAVSINGNASYFGTIRVEALTLSLLGPGVLVALCCGVTGGLFARALAAAQAGQFLKPLMRLRARAPVRFAAGCGLIVAVLGLMSQGEVFGGGYLHTRAMLENTGDASPWYAPLKWLATWITSLAGVPAGIFAPSLAIGGALGNDIAQWTHHLNAPTLIALGMAGFLAAVTQAPLTAFIIVMEMVDGHALVLSLMACAMVASGVSRLISRPLYATLAELQLKRLPDPAAATDSRPQSTDRRDGAQGGQ